MSRVFVSDVAAFDSEVLRSDLPVVAEFTSEWGEWSDRNVMMGEMAREYAGRVGFAIVDVDSYCPGIALAYVNKGVAALFASGTAR